MKKILAVLLLAILASSCTKTEKYPDPISGTFVGSLLAVSVNNPSDRYEQNDVAFTINGKDGEMSLAANDVCLDGEYFVDMMLLPVEYGCYTDGSVVFGVNNGVPFIDMHQNNYYTIRSLMGQISPYGNISMTFTCAGYLMSFTGSSVY
ncbi:MAG: hypothetical protein PHD21_06640 [Flavobacteriales bacterium]|nr:hypothetical protein [Flavobacteriales bacterium]